MTTQTIDITTVTSQALRERRFAAVFPEYYALENVIENSLWHDHQKVLDHVIAVFAGLETVLEFRDMSEEQKIKTGRYLSEKIQTHTRLETLKVATLLHDIAKNDTIITAADGSARAPGHELIGAARVVKFAPRFGLTEQETQVVERIVRYHGLISDFLTLIIETGNKEKYLGIYKETVGDISIELVLLMHADLLGSDLKKADPKAYTDRIEVLEWLLGELL